MNHFASPSFWECYANLPVVVKQLADKNFELLKRDKRHPSLHLKKVGKYLSVRVGKRHRALSVMIKEGALWFWIGTHAEYDKLLD